MTIDPNLEVWQEVAEELKAHGVDPFSPENRNLFLTLERVMLHYASTGYEKGYQDGYRDGDNSSQIPNGMFLY